MSVFFFIVKACSESYKSIFLLKYENFNDMFCNIPGMRGDSFGIHSVVGQLMCNLLL